VDLAIETVRILPAVRAEIDALRMIQAGPNYLNLMNIVTRQFRQLRSLPRAQAVLLKLFESRVS